MSDSTKTQSVCKHCSFPKTSYIHAPNMPSFAHEFDPVAEPASTGEPLQECTANINKNEYHCICSNYHEHNGVCRYHNSLFHSAPQTSAEPPDPWIECKGRTQCTYCANGSVAIRTGNELTYKHYVPAVPKPVSGMQFKTDCIADDVTEWNKRKSGDAPKVEEIWERWHKETYGNSIKQYEDHFGWRTVAWRFAEAYAAILRLYFPKDKE